MLFDATWADNRKHLRKGMTGTGMKADPVTGYLEAMRDSGFTAKKKVLFIERLKLCKGFCEVARSVKVDVGAVYDALVLDLKFRDAVNQAQQMPDRKSHLNDALETIKFEETSQTVAELSKAAEKYKK